MTINLACRIAVKNQDLLAALNARVPAGPAAAGARPGTDGLTGPAARVVWGPLADPRRAGRIPDRAPGGLQ